AGPPPVCPRHARGGAQVASPAPLPRPRGRVEPLAKQAVGWGQAPWRRWSVLRMPPLPASPQAEGGADGARSGRVPCGQAVLSGGRRKVEADLRPRVPRRPSPRLRGEAGRGAGERPPPYNSPMKKSDFHYELPPELIAQEPLPERSGSRMLVLPPGQAPPVDARIRQLGDWLRPGDLLVFNDTRVIPARLFGQKDTGGRVEILVERLLP